MVQQTVTMTKHDLEARGPRGDRPKRRHFSAEYKLRIVAEYDAAPSGEKGAILRREGLYDHAPGEEAARPNRAPRRTVVRPTGALMVVS
jgi:hypothetical protein